MNLLTTSVPKWLLTSLFAFVVVAQTAMAQSIPDLNAFRFGISVFTSFSTDPILDSLLISPGQLNLTTGQFTGTLQDGTQVTGQISQIPGRPFVVSYRITFSNSAKQYEGTLAYVANANQANIAGSLSQEKRTSRPGQAEGVIVEMSTLPFCANGAPLIP